MTAASATHRQARRNYAELLPTRDEWIDAGFVAILTLVALYGFRAAYGGVAYLVVGAVGLLIGVVLAHVAARANQGFLVVVAITLCAAVLLSGGVLRDTAIGGVLPSLDTLRGMGTAIIRGWKQLLTTVHPVGTAENLLTLPYLMGLVAGVGGYSLARRAKQTGLPVLVPVVVLALSILFGAKEPTAAFLQGAVFAGVAIAWTSVRFARRKESVVQAQGRWARPLTAAVVVVASVAGSWVIGPHLPFAGSHQRRVLHVSPPFDASAYPSPLAGFRRFTKNASSPLYATPLMTVQGLPAGQSVRIAVLDQYDGVVWGAANGTDATSDVGGFARVGSTIPAAVKGKSTPIQFSLTGYNDVWLPDAGAVTGVTFRGTDADRLQTALRFSTATGTGLVPGGVVSGETYTVRAIFRPALTNAQLGQATPYGAPDSAKTSYDFIKTAAAKLGAAGSTPMTRFIAIASTLQQGRYSDGQDSGDTEPGHGAGRLVTFLGAKQLVGDDEQYSAAMALLANAVGVPARAVLGAIPEADGSVEGKDVTASIEIELTGYGWVSVPASIYTPDRSKGPDPVQQQKPPKAAPQVIPPPLKLPPPPAVDPATQADSQAAQQLHHAAPRRPAAKPLVPVPAAVTHVARYVGPPVLLILLWVALILGIKALRRRRRRTKGRATTRIAMGWVEILDCVRDLGGPANTRQTRRQQALALESPAAVDVAAVADRVIFSAGEPTQNDVDQFWQLVKRQRSDLKGSVGLGRRLRSALSLRSLHRRSSKPDVTAQGDEAQAPRRAVVGADS